MATVYSKKDGVSLPTPDRKNYGSTEDHFFTPDIDHGEGTFLNGKFERHHGLNWLITGVFVIGELAGGGLVALPSAITRSGFVVGITTLVSMTLIFTYTGYILGQCWVILQRNWPEYRVHCRKPYAEISYRAIGIKFKTFVSVCINVTQFGITVVFLLLASNNICDFIKTFFHKEISFCWVILAVAVAIFPLLILKSPEEFWWAGIIAMCTTSCAVILICIGSIRDYYTCSNGRNFPDFKISNYFVALGPILFAYSGHPVFPTIQHDMRKPHHFTRSLLMAFGVLTCMYLPASILGSLSYGDSLRDSVINSLQTQWIQSAVNICITLHVIFTIIIMSNPVNQEIEELFNVPQEFSIWRVITRGSTFVAAVFIAETVPRFGPMLDLVGASTMTLTSLFFPSVFYLYLNAREAKAEEKSSNIEKKNSIDETPSFGDIVKYNSKVTLVVCAFVIAFGIIGGGGATYSAIKELIFFKAETPCYLRPFLGHDPQPETDSHTNCCGMWQNVTRSPDIKCNTPLDFYNQGKNFSRMEL